LAKKDIICISMPEDVQNKNRDFFLLMYNITNLFEKNVCIYLITISQKLFYDIVCSVNALEIKPWFHTIS
jgi:hypothetical protein